MEIRTLQRKDLDDLLLLYCHLHTDDQPQAGADTIDRVWSLIEQNDGLIYLGAFIDGKLTASCTLTLIPNLTRGCRPYGVIENVVTHNAYRRRGLGMAVLRCALEMAWKHSCYKVMLMTGRLNKETFRFYESAGFSRQGKQAFIARTPE